ncbi:MAG: hypothetical protein J6U50_02535 [Lachnospiraceae bacterium]|nr:hypothetical protein [Lachnospiraceae bacterium]
MRLFLYYFVHTAINTIKKLLKTWVAFFLIIMVMGGVVGFVVGTIVPKIAGTISEENVTEEEDEQEDTADEPGAFSTFMDTYGLDKAGVTDLIVTAAFFFVITLSITSSGKSGQLFKPADVPMLFSSPLKPQSVLMFRLIMNLGFSLFMTIYMMFQLPNLIFNAGFSTWAAFSIIIAYGFVMVFSTLVQVSFYTIVCRGESGKSKSAGKAVYIFYGVLALALIIYKTVTGKDSISAAISFFGSRKTFWIPFYGWIRGMIYHAICGDTVKSVIYTVLFVIACIGIVILIWNIKADFYEDAMFAAERMAARLEDAKNADKGAVATREKSRSDKLVRDGFHYGFGASVFFYKSIINRFRFGIFRIFSKTMLIGVACVLFSVYMLKDTSLKIDPFIVPGALLLVITFYRTLGNPLSEDTSREFFVLVPESPFKKIMASLLGSIAVTAIDLALPIILAGVLLGTSPLNVILWFVFLLSVSVFGTTVGTFINLSVPGEHAQTVKTMLQVLFIYFGMIPAAAFVVAGVLLGKVAICMIIGAFCNVLLGMLFASLSPHFLMNR